MRVPLAKPVFDDELRDAALDALENERFVLGESVFRFEEEFAKYCGVKYAVSVSSGTCALQFSLLALGVGRDDHVITTPYSFVATANAVLHVDALPVFADVSVETYNIEQGLMRGKLIEKIRVVIPLLGIPHTRLATFWIAGI